MIAHGCVKTDEEVLLKNVAFRITQRKSSGPKLGSWSGSFTISTSDQERVLKVSNICDSDGPFYLVLLDGTSGRIHPVLCRSTARKVTVSFTGSGDLEKNPE